MSFLHNLGDNPRAIAEFSSLTDWQIVQMYVLPAEKRAAEARQRNGGPMEVGKVVDADESGNPVVPSLAFLVSKYRAGGCTKEAAEAGAKSQIAAFKKLHGLK